jgi:hypothetical protein
MVLIGAKVKNYDDLRRLYGTLVADRHQIFSKEGDMLEIGRSARRSYRNSDHSEGRVLLLKPRLPVSSGQGAGGPPVLAGLKSQLCKDICP